MVRNKILAKPNFTNLLKLFSLEGADKYHRFLIKF